MPTVEQLWLQALPPGTELVAGEEGIFGEVSWVVVLRPSPPGFDNLKGSELALMSGEVVSLLGVSLTSLVSSLAERGVSAIGFAGRLTADAVKEAGSHGLPLFTFPSGTPIAALETNILRLINEERGRLYQLERELSQSLMPLALAGKDAPTIIEQLRALTGRAVGLADANLNPVFDLDEGVASALRNAVRPMTDRYGGAGVIGVEITAKLSGFLGPVTAGGKVEGYLVLTAPRRNLEEADRVIVRAGILALEVERSRRHAVEETEDRFREELVESLLGGELSSIQTLAERAKRVGLDLSREYVAMAVRVTDSPHDRETLKGKTNSLLKKTWCHYRGDILVILHPAVAAMPAAGLRQLAREVAQRLASNLAGTVALGLGRYYPGAGGIRLSLQEAEQALTLGVRLFGPGSATYFGDLGVYRLLFSLKTAGELEAFQQEYLGRLLEYDQKHGGELIATLDARLRSNTIAETAETLHIHRNTLLYRLQRIQEISGQDLEDAETRLILHLALRAGEAIRIG
ncbi:MAG: helix-turn-helix domain-containing protein [Chloroflexi bacterium]|nr:helix-turn-helix domain-containing protein [Chloroflexota bacterium]